MHALTAKKIQFFLIIYMIYHKKKYMHLPQKKDTRLDDFFVHDLHFSHSDCHNCLMCRILSASFLFSWALRHCQMLVESSRTLGGHITTMGTTGIVLN